MNKIAKFLKSLIEFGKFQTNLGEASPVREFPSEPLTQAQKDELRKLLPRKPLSFKAQQSPGGIRIALDESVGNAMAKKLEELGYKIVCRAGTAELDTVWMARALQQKALFIVSPDLDIPSLIEKENYPMIWVDFLYAANVNPTIQAQTRDVKRGIWVQYVHDRIQAKLKFFNKEFGGDIYAKGNNP